MKLPRFVLGLIGALLAFFVVTYLLTGSLWSSILETVLCAILIQVGYFIVMLLMVARTKPGETASERSPEGDAHSVEDRPANPSHARKINALHELRRDGTLK